jgi:hypothetical protein
MRLYRWLTSFTNERGRRDQPSSICAATRLAWIAFNFSVAGWVDVLEGVIADITEAVEALGIGKIRYNGVGTEPPVKISPVLSLTVDSDHRLL